MNNCRSLFPYLLFLCFLIFASCKQDPVLDSDLLVGTYRGMDRNIPYPFLLEKKSDSIFLINHQNKVIGESALPASDYQAGDTLKMQGHQFFILRPEPELLLFGIDDTISFPYIHSTAGASFKRATESKELNLEKLKDRLLKTPFTSEISVIPNRDLEVVKTWYFSEDSLRTVFSYFYQDSLMYAEQQLSGLHFFERRGKIFFSENEDIENPKTLYQITDVNSNSFDIQYYKDHKKRVETYTSTEKQEPFHQIPYFSRCLDGKPGEYYHDNVTYNKGNDYLLEKISRNAPLAEGNGYITVHFDINCHGAVGRIGLEQMDRDYKSTSFSPDLVQHLIDEVLQLRDWPEVEPSSFFKDVHAFLMFKVENGKLTDLCP